MPLGKLKREEIEEFQRNHHLIQKIVVAVECMHASAEVHHRVPYMNGTEQEIYNYVLDALARISEMLHNIEGRPIEACPIDQKLSGANGYTLVRYQKNGTHKILIQRVTDPEFYWKIGVQDDGLNMNHITGFYHRVTNANLTTLTAAYESTKHLFPAISHDLSLGHDSEELQPRSRTGSTSRPSF